MSTIDHHLAQAPTGLWDGFGRRHTALRLSVVDRCNLRCHYCMPAEGLAWTPRKDILSYEQMTAAVEVACALGVTNVRLTGGEPLLRRDIARLVELLKTRTPLTNLSLTTNGLLLARDAQSLRDAGLDRLNVSLDSLQPERFARITRNGLLEKVWQGIDAAIAAGLAPIKINTLLLKDFNEDEVGQWLELTRTRPLTVRFMELMPIGQGARMEGIGSFLNLSRLRETLIEEHGLMAAHCPGNGPARYYQQPGALGKIGFITPLSHKYCNSCSRLRLSSTGKLRACLAFDEEVDLGPAIRAGDPVAIEAGFRQAVAQKRAGHHWELGQVTDTGMSQMGG